MTALDPGDAQGFIVRIYKYLATNPSLMWANSYELISTSDLGPGAGDNIVTALLNFEAAIHLDDVRFDRAVLSTYVADGEPYDPESFIVYPSSLEGEVSTVGKDPRSLNDCLFVRRVVASGRTGKIFYRRCLTDEDITSPAGSIQLADTSPVWDTVATAFSTYLFDYTNGSEDFRLCLIALGQQVRNIAGFAAAGARVRQYNNRWFDVP